jgi:hypothetical protein
MCAIAKRLIAAAATSTQGDVLSARCTERFAAHVTQFKIALDAQRSIVSNGDFRRHISFSFTKNAARVHVDSS